MTVIREGETGFKKLASRLPLVWKDLSIPLIAPPLPPTLAKFFADKLIIKFSLSSSLSPGGIVKDFNYISVTQKRFGQLLCLSAGFSSSLIGRGEGGGSAHYCTVV